MNAVIPMATSQQMPLCCGLTVESLASVHVSAVRDEDLMIGSEVQGLLTSEQKIAPIKPIYSEGKVIILTLRAQLFLV